MCNICDNIGVDAVGKCIWPVEFHLIMIDQSLHSWEMFIQVEYV